MQVGKSIIDCQLKRTTFRFNQYLLRSFHFCHGDYQTRSGTHGRILLNDKNQGYRNVLLYTICVTKNSNNIINVLHCNSNDHRCTGDGPQKSILLFVIFLCCFIPMSFARLLVFFHEILQFSLARLSCFYCPLYHFCCLFYIFFCWGCSCFYLILGIKTLDFSVQSSKTVSSALYPFLYPINL